MTYDNESNDLKNQNNNVHPAYAGLKKLVIIMGVMIIFGAIGLGYGFYKKYGQIAGESGLENIADNNVITLPKNMRALSITALHPKDNFASGGGVLAILLQDNNGRQAIMIYNPKPGQSKILPLQNQTE